MNAIDLFKRGVVQQQQPSLQPILCNDISLAVKVLATRIRTYGISSCWMLLKRWWMKSWRIFFTMMIFIYFITDWISAIVIGAVKHQSIESYQWVFVHRCNIVIDDWLAYLLAGWLACSSTKKKKITADGLSVHLSVYLFEKVKARLVDRRRWSAGQGRNSTRTINICSVSQQ